MSYLFFCNILSRNHAKTHCQLGLPTFPLHLESPSVWNPILPVNRDSCWNGVKGCFFFFVYLFWSSCNFQGEPWWGQIEVSCPTQQSRTSKALDLCLPRQTGAEESVSLILSTRGLHILRTGDLPKWHCPNASLARQFLSPNTNTVQVKDKSQREQRWSLFISWFSSIFVYDSSCSFLMLEKTPKEHFTCINIPFWICCDETKKYHNSCVSSAHQDQAARERAEPQWVNKDKLETGYGWILRKAG